MQMAAASIGSVGRRKMRPIRVTAEAAAVVRQPSPIAPGARRLLLATVPWAVLLVVWIGIRELGLVNPTLLPSPAQVLAQGWRRQRVARSGSTSSPPRCG